MLSGLDSAQTVRVVLTVWDGVGLARACGLMAAASDTARAPRGWRRRQANAQTCEYLIARQLNCTAAAAGRGLRLSVLVPAGEVPGPRQAETAAAAVIGFAEAAGPAVLAAAADARVWDDRRGLSACSTLAAELAACWRGERPSYQLIIEEPAPPWWPDRVSGISRY